MFTDVASKTHNVKILFIGPAQVGKERAVSQIARVSGGGVEPGRWGFGGSSYMTAAGGRVAVTDLPLRVNAMSSDTLARLRSSSLGLQVVSCGRGLDGFDLVLHLYWLPVELLPGMLQAGRIAGEWLRGADGVVYVADGREDRAVLNASGFAQLHAWLAAHEPHLPIAAVQIIHRTPDAPRRSTFAIDGVRTFETVLETADGIEPLALYLERFAEQARPRTDSIASPLGRRRRAKTTRRRSLAA